MQSVLETPRAESAAVTPGLVRRLLAHSYLRHNVLLLLATVATGACNFLFHPVLEHQLKADAYGKVASLLGFLSILLIPTLIITAIMAKYASTLSAAGSLDRLNDLVRRLTAILLPVGLGAALIFALASGIIAPFFHVRSTQLIILGLAFSISFASPVNIGSVQGLQRFGWYSVLTVLPAILRVALAAALVAAGLGINGAVLGIVLSVILPYAISFQPLRAVLTGPRARHEPLRSLWSYSLTAAIALACMTLLFNLDTVLAEHYLAGQTAGYYAALATLGKTSLFVAGSVVAVMFPRVATLRARGESTARVVAQSLLGVLALSLTAEVAFIVAPGLFLSIFEHKFVAVQSQLAWYGLAMVFLAQAQALIYYFLTTSERFLIVALPACCGLLAGLIFWHHGTAAQIVQAVVAANGLLCVALLSVFALRAWQERQRRTMAGTVLAPAARLTGDAAHE